ncbi:MlaA family lipoprotein [Roseobacteraceae bacterium S113]
MAGCTTPEQGSVSSNGVFDPYEAENRKVHALNKSLDRAVLRPAGIAYTTVVPDGVEETVSHFASNLSVPGDAINHVLQGRLDVATRNVLRFGINSTFGLAGLADVATDWGIPEEDTDFGQTLAIWGLPQGAFLELPVLGPASERDAVGKAVDYVINPLRQLEAPESDIATGARVAAGLGARGRFTSTIDGLLYDSADSYAAARDIYLQNRAFELEQVGVTSGEESDPYADIFGE